MPEATDQADTTTAQPPVDQSSSDKSIMGATPTPQPDLEPAPTEEGTEGQAPTEETSPDSDGPGVSAAVNGATKEKAPWFQKRIDQLTWEKNEERRSRAAVEEQNRVLLAQLEASRTIQQPVTQTPSPNVQSPASTATPQAPVKPVVNMSEAEIEARALVKARQIAEKSAFDKACNTIAMQGKEAYNDFDGALKTFEMLGGIPQPLLEAITDMPNAHKVLYALGKDPELADRIVKMPVAKMGMELARVETAVNKPAVKQVSAARTPITPIDTTAVGGDDPDKMSTAQWIQWREKTKKTRW